MSTKTKRITESAMLLAIAIVLELVAKLFIPEMPFGGQVTIVSMLPVVLISYRHGLKWGFVAALTYAALEMAIGIKTVSAAFLPGSSDFGSGIMMIVKALTMCLLDYVLAFSVLGLGGIFRNKIKNNGVALMCGSLVALSARYLCHFLSGCILYHGWAKWFFEQDGFPTWGAQLANTLHPAVLAMLYSLIYNGTFMVPEIILTAIMALVIARIPKVVTKIS